MTGRLRTCAIAVAAGLIWPSAFAAGGHHAVDDAALLERGQCKLEGWLEQADDSNRLLHAGGACRVGPVELGAASEYERLDGASQTSHGLGIKWAAPLRENLSAGLSWSPGWQARAQPRYQGSTLSALLTWNATDTINLHANLGREFVHQGRDDTPAGVSIDWSPTDRWTLMAERYRAEGGHFLRAGIGWQPAEGWSIDLSRAHRLRGPGASSWTLALSREFDR